MHYPRFGLRRGEGSLVTRVHRLQHVEGLADANLADDDSVGAHAKRIPNELPKTPTSGTGLSS
jgi:hypothetical protein